MKYFHCLFLLAGCVLPLVLSQTGASFHASCDTLVLENVDPVVFPNQVGAGHGHRVVGANGFYSGSTAVSPNPATDPATSIFKSSTGTTCNIPQDLSAYWQPILYYQLSSNKNLIRAVDQAALSYYNFYSGAEIFPSDFKVLVGKATRTKTSGDLDNPAVFFEYPVGTKLYDFPAIQCSVSTNIRAHVFFPHCGKLDPVTGKYIFTYPPGFRTGAEIPKVGGFNYGGSGCPAGYKVFPQLHQAFHYSVANICSGGNLLPGRFVWANGNPDGRGLHADFLNGWDPVTLNSILARCVSNRSCPTDIFTPRTTPTYTRKEGTQDYVGTPSGIPLTTYTQPGWGWIFPV
jgi:hypothetical protein